MEDEEYFEREDDNENVNPQEKGSTPVSDKNTEMNIEEVKTSENDIQTRRDHLLKIQNNIASRNKFDDDEDKFIFGSKSKGKVNQVEKQTKPNINIQFSLGNSIIENDSNTTEQEKSNKRPGADLEADEDIKEESKIEAEKRMKI
jgi:hypothetical protein